MEISFWVGPIGSAFGWGCWWYWVGVVVGVSVGLLGFLRVALVGGAG